MNGPTSTESAPAGASRLPQLLAGGTMTVAGLATALEARTFGMGTLDRMGPGLYPTVLGICLALVGVLIAVTPDRADEHDAATHTRPDWRGWLCILGGVAAFIVLGEHGGLAPATFACVFLSALGDRKATLLGSFILAAGMTLLAAVVFSSLLKFQLPLWQW